MSPADRCPFHNAPAVVVHSYQREEKMYVELRFRRVAIFLQTL